MLQHANDGQASTHSALRHVIAAATWIDLAGRQAAAVVYPQVGPIATATRMTSMYDRGINQMQPTQQRAARRTS